MPLKKQASTKKAGAKTKAQNKKSQVSKTGKASKTKESSNTTYVMVSSSVAKKSKKKTPAQKATKKTTSTKLAIEKKEEKQKKDHQKAWENLYKKAKDIRPVPFRMSNSFSAKTAIKHPIFGWGWIVSNKNDRLHVMFKDKNRMLLSNQSVILSLHKKKTT